MLKVRITRKGVRYHIEYKTGFFSRWKCVSELGMAAHVDDLKKAYDRANRVRTQFKDRPLTEIVEVLK